MHVNAGKLTRILMLVLVAAAFYLLTTYQHAQRAEIRQAAVSLTPACVEKLTRYALDQGEYYRSPYVVQRTGAAIARRGYSDEDIRAIQRGCNILTDTQ